MQTLGDRFVMFTNNIHLVIERSRNNRGNQRIKIIINMSTLERAIEIAVLAHKGQTDKEGQPYILHPLRMMFNVKMDEEKMAAVMHDVVEERDWTLDQLKVEGFSENEIEAIDRLIRKESDSYERFIEIAGGNPISRIVKIADLTDNMDLSRINNLREKDFLRLKKYKKAMTYLKNEKE